MSKWRKAAKVDKVQSGIVMELRALGISVELGMDDILVGYAGVTYWIEIKSGVKSRLTAGQKTLREGWKGQYSVCWSTTQILDLIGYNLLE